MPGKADSPIWAALRSAADSFSAGALDPVSAALDAAIPGVGKIDNPNTETMWDKGHSFKDAYQHNLAIMQAQAAANKGAYPKTTTAGEVISALISPVNKVAAPIKGAGLAARAARLLVPAATYGAVHGASTAPAGSSATDIALRSAKEMGENTAGAAVLAPVLRGAGAVLNKIRPSVAAAATDAAGNYTPEFKSAVKGAFPNGEVQPHHIDPDIASAIVAEKGATPEAVRKAVARQSGVDPTAGMTTDTGVPNIVKNNEAIMQHRTQGKAAVANAVSGITQGAEPDPAALSGAVASGYVRAKRAVSNAYATLAANKTVVGPSFAQTLPDAINANLRDNPYLPGISSIGEALQHPDTPEFSKLILGGKRQGYSIPSLLDRIGSLAPAGGEKFYRIGNLEPGEGPQFSRDNSGDWFDDEGNPLPDAQSQRLERGVQARLLGPGTDKMSSTVAYTPNPASLENIDNLRKMTNNAYDAANNPTDRAAIRSFQDAIDGNLKTTLTNGDHGGEPGDGELALQQLGDAHDANTFLKSNYEDRVKANPAIADAVSAMKIAPDANGNLAPSVPPTEMAAIGNNLGSKIINPKNLAVTPQNETTYSQLKNIGLSPDEENAVSDYVRAHVAKTAVNGFGDPLQLAHNPQNILNFLKTPNEVNNNLFTPAEESTLRTGAVTHNMLEGKTPSGSDVTPSDVNYAPQTLPTTALRIAAPVAGAAAAHFFGHGIASIPVASEVIGGLAGRGAGNLLERLTQASGARNVNRILATEMGGAPAAAPTALDVAGAAPSIASGALAATSKTPEPPPASPIPPGPLTLDQAFSKPDAAPTDSTPPAKGITLDQAFATDDRSQRASGGRTNSDIEHLVKALMAKAKSAKRVSDSVTKPLLGVHDNAIASALAVAQKAI